MALPMRVFLTISCKAIIKTTVIATIRTCSMLTVTPPNWKVLAMSPVIAGYVRTLAFTKYIMPYSSRYETPMAVISTAMRVALRRGLYATFSMMTPSTMQTSMAAHSETANPKWRNVIQA